MRLPTSTLAFLFFSLGACLDQRVTSCADGRLCPEGTACDEAHEGCVLPEQLERCSDEPDGTPCSYRGVRDGACYDGVCLPAGCGNGRLDEDEVCDDGNRAHNDGCAADCRSDERCGNGIIDLRAGESCDPPGTRSCRADCVSVTCGDGTVDRDALELCDLGALNSSAPDAACRPTCQPRRCGDGITDTGEVCDDGNRLSDDSCSFDCLSNETCGNGYRDPGQGEECDDGNYLNHDGCSSTCLAERPRIAEITSPGAPRRVPVLHDPSRDVFLTVTNATFELRESQWRVVTSAAPRASGHYGLAWDPLGRRALLFAGHSNAGAYLNETWAWNGAAWSELAVTGERPSPRQQPAITFDPVHNRLVLFGGENENGELRDTWQLTGTTWSRVASAAAPRAGARAMVFDPEAGVPLLFDGAKVWSLSTDGWHATDLTVPAQAENAEECSFLVVPGTGHRWLYFHPTENQTGSLWEFQDGAWHARPAPPIEAGGPFSRDPPYLAHQPSTDRLLVVDRRNDVWEWDGTSWTRRTFDSERRDPPTRYSHAMAYDPLNDRTLMFGGDPSGEVDCAETWLWEDDTWTQVLTSPTPTECAGSEVVYDPRLRTFVLFGGRTVDGTPTSNTYTFDGRGWNLVPVAPDGPSPRSSAAMAFDLTLDDLLMFGGQDSDGAPLADLWKLGQDGWRASPLAPSPPARFKHAMAYDPVAGHILLAGGEASSDRSVDDTWSLAGTGWSAFPAITVPSTLYRNALIYEPQRRSMVMITYHEEIWELLRSSAHDTSAPWHVLEFASGFVTALEGHQAVYEATRARTLILGMGFTPTSAFSYSAPAQPDEACRFGFDTDGDSLIGCDDPDCWPFCTPLCPPGAPCDLTYPHCGDGECNEALETCRMCPEDCGACPALCGDFFCDAPETVSSCPGDCTPH